MRRYRLYGPAKMIYDKGLSVPAYLIAAKAHFKDSEVTAMKFRMAGQNIDHWNGPDRSKPNESTSESFLKPYFNTIKSVSFADVPVRNANTQYVVALGIRLHQWFCL